MPSYYIPRKLHVRKKANCKSEKKRPAACFCRGPGSSSKTFPLFYIQGQLHILGMEQLMGLVSVGLAQEFLVHLVY